MQLSYLSALAAQAWTAGCPHGKVRQHTFSHHCRRQQLRGAQPSISGCLQVPHQIHHAGSARHEAAVEPESYMLILKADPESGGVCRERNDLCAQHMQKVRAKKHDRNTDEELCLQAGRSHKRLQVWLWIAAQRLSNKVQLEATAPAGRLDENHGCPADRLTLWRPCWRSPSDEWHSSTHGAGLPHQRRRPHCRADSISEEAEVRSTSPASLHSTVSPFGPLCCTDTAVRTTPPLQSGTLLACHVNPRPAGPSFTNIRQSMKKPEWPDTLSSQTCIGPPGSHLLD